MRSMGGFLGDGTGSTGIPQGSVGKCDILIIAKQMAKQNVLVKTLRQSRPWAACQSCVLIRRNADVEKNGACCGESCLYGTAC